MVNNVTVDENLDISDHNIIRFKLNVIAKSQLVENKVKSLALKMQTLINSEACLEPEWENEFENQNHLQMWESFKSILDKFQSMHFTQRKSSWWSMKIEEKSGLRVSSTRGSKTATVYWIWKQRKIGNELYQVKMI